MNFDMNIPQMVIFDFETTGLSHENDYPTEIGMKLIGAHPFDGRPYEREYSSLIQIPFDYELSDFIKELTGLTTQKINEQGQPIEKVIQEVHEFLGDAGVNGTLFVAHNANFDLGFLSTHFGIEPEHFLCTRSMSILTAPHKNASLKNVYADFFPESDLIQQHRAMDDIHMTEEILGGFIYTQGADCIPYFMNRLVSMPDRELGYIPPHAKVLDFTQKYEAKHKGTKRINAEYLATLEEDAEKLAKLEAYGVDNWSGYCDALNSDDE